MRIQGFLVGTASAIALLSGAAHAQTSDDAPVSAET